MTTRTVHYKITPRRARPATVPRGPLLRFDMADVAAPAMQEVIGTAAGAVSLHAMLEDLLVAQTRSPDLLTWREDGVGVGIEMKRGFSGILGRFFARWYLQAHHGLTHFVPINGEGAIVSQNVVVRRTGQFHLPDWICLGPNGRPALAESKGSHSKAGWLGPGSAPPLRKAKQQLQKAIVQVTDPTTGRLRRSRVKGWAVMSRWATVQNCCSPLLYALDPETEGFEMSDSQVEVAGRDIRRAALSRYLHALGQATIAERLFGKGVESQESDLRARSNRAEREWARRGQGTTLSPLASPSFLDVRRPSVPVAGIKPEVVRIADKQLGEHRFVGGVVDLTGRLIPNNVSEIVQGRATGPTGVFRDLYFAGFDVAALAAEIQGKAFEPRAPLRVERRSSAAVLPAVSLLADGFVLAPIEALSDEVEGEPEEVTLPR